MFTGRGRFFLRLGFYWLCHLGYLLSVISNSQVLAALSETGAATLGTSTMSDKAIIIGGGMAGLASTALLAKKGFDVTLVEKNERLGGVANRFDAEGFSFDMGPSWYLMPDVFQNFFNLLGERVEDHLDLVRLDPSYRIFFQAGDSYNFASDFERDSPIFEKLEPGSAAQLAKYLERSKKQYEIALGGFMYRNADTPLDFLNKQVATEGRELEVFARMSDYVAKYFKTDEVQKIMEYQLVFLGSSPYNTPALYNIMSHIDFSMGVWYPMGGIHQIPMALQSIGEKYGAKYLTNAPAARILTKTATGRGRARVRGVRLEDGRELEADLVIANAPIHHVEQKLLPSGLRKFSPRYWESRTLAPSALILYLGIRGRVESLTHHNLLFARDWKSNFGEIFDAPAWPAEPSLYVCAPSVTDPTVAPPDHENLFVLVPIAAGLHYDQAILDDYVQKTLNTIEREMSVPDLRERIVFQKVFSVKDFAERYNTHKGTALGLAHTMKQTALLRPNNWSKKVEGLFYAGANTNPGIGMPIQLISAELAYKRIIGDKSAGHLVTL
jgi:phytoene desaturase